MRQGPYIRIASDTDASITVDVQPTFMPGGGLPVPEGHLVVPTVLRCEGLFLKERRFATLDRHPRGHISLASSYQGFHPDRKVLSSSVASDWVELPTDCVAPHALFTYWEVRQYLAQVGSQVLWPDHAIDGTKEAELHPSLWRGRYVHVQIKGMDPHCDSYSGINDALGRPTGLGDALKSAGAKRVFVWGLAYDFCVGWTALDAAKLGFETFVVRDATRSVGLGDSVARMDADLAAAGIRQVASIDLTL